MVPGVPAKPPALLQVPARGLLRHDVLSGLHGRCDQLGVEVALGADIDHVHVLPGHHLAPVCEDIGIGKVETGSTLLRKIARGVHQGDDLSPIRLSHPPADVPTADSPAADHGDTESIHCAVPPETLSILWRITKRCQALFVSERAGQPNRSPGWPASIVQPCAPTVSGPAPWRPPGLPSPWWLRPLHPPPPRRGRGCPSSSASFDPPPPEHPCPGKTAPHSLGS